MLRLPTAQKPTPGAFLRRDESQIRGRSSKRTVVELATLPELATELATPWWPTPHFMAVVDGATTLTWITVR